MASNVIALENICLFDQFADPIQLLYKKHPAESLLIICAIHVPFVWGCVVGEDLECYKYPWLSGREQEGIFAHTDVCPGQSVGLGIL